jgi:hypothetical protein
METVTLIICWARDEEQSDSVVTAPSLSQVRRVCTLRPVPYRAGQGIVDNYMALRT